MPLHPHNCGEGLLGTMGENAKDLTENCWIVVVVSNYPEIGGDWVAQCCCRVLGRIALVAKLQND